MRINSTIDKIDNINVNAVIFFIFQDVKKLDRQIFDVDKKLDGMISLIIRKGYFKGKNRELHTIYTHGKIKADKIILAGLGQKNKFNQEILFRAFSGALNYLKNISSTKILAVFDNLENIKNIDFLNLAVIARITDYHFLNYKTRDKDIHTIQELTFHFGNKDLLNKFNLIAKDAKEISEAVNWCRDLINHPGNYLTPKTFSKHVKELKGTNVKINIFGKNKIKELGMGLILGVAKGSDEEPQLIIVDYQPKKFKDTIVLVGKGLTFDSGGISIKDSEKMDEMKMDMAGAAAVLGAVRAISRLKLNIRVIGIVPAAENLPSGKALKPGDILKSYSGLNVEIISTDAEGRLILGDALCYSQKFKPSAIIDMATLTGACVVALGYEAAAVLGNNQKLIEKIIKAADKTGERVWQLPLWDVYKEKMKSDIADIKNSDNGKGAGVITGALFLENFVGNFPWAHIDIGGTAFNDDSKPYNPKGATGYGVRLLVDLIKNWTSLDRK